MYKALLRNLKMEKRDVLFLTFLLSLGSLIGYYASGEISIVNVLALLTFSLSGWIIGATIVTINGSRTANERSYGIRLLAQINHLTYCKEHSDFKDCDSDICDTARVTLDMAKL